MTMLAQHEWPEANRKRIRDDEYADVASGGTLGFTEHRSKRLQSLPLRTSPSSKRWSGSPPFSSSYSSFGSAAPPPVTVGSSETEDGTNARLQDFHPEPQLWSQAPTLVAQEPSPSPMMHEVDADMDMMMDTFEPLPSLDQPGREIHLEPGPSQPDPIAPSISGRMPTPIHCSFAAQVRGNNWGGAAGNVMQSSPLATTHADEDEIFQTNSAGSDHQTPAMLGDESIPRSLDGPAATAAVMADWTMVRNRRLPSPISESGCEDCLDSPGMVLDSSPQLAQVNPHGYQHPMLSALPPRATSAMELGQAGGGTPPPREDTPAADALMEASTPSPRKGHTRSRHTLNSWTALQPGMKRSFSIGYRADCEKCRMKVPGHFNHIIIS